MRIRYCPDCKKAGLKWDDANGKGYDGMTDRERYSSNIPVKEGLFNMRYCPRCHGWVHPNLSSNYDQHKR
jgi:hypothetical protein